MASKKSHDINLHSNCWLIFFSCSALSGGHTGFLTLPLACFCFCICVCLCFSQSLTLHIFQTCKLWIWSAGLSTQLIKFFPREDRVKKEPSCPAGTFFSGYTMDSLQQWKIVCLTTMSVEDAEDVYIFGFLITGFLLFGAGGYLTYRVSSKTWAAVHSIPKLPAMLDGIYKAINAQTELLREVSRKLDTVLEQNCSLEAAFGLRGERI
ncbi:hypothetical protein ILYODFUR_031040 [Ilyodon furcidens]|uniref:Uncharacterized protein n=1 Tax=Ilyodon furcidens TaxID=33524 RepID=A0ABV0V7L7_9TELE